MARIPIAKLPSRCLVNVRYVLVSKFKFKDAKAIDHMRGKDHEAFLERFGIAQYPHRNSMERFLAQGGLIPKVRYEIVGPGHKRVFTSTPVETAREIERGWDGKKSI